MSETNEANEAAPLLLAPPATTKKADPAATPAPAPTAVRPPRSLWPVWFALGFVILAGGEGYLYTQQRAHEADATTLAVLNAEVTDLRNNAARTSPVTALINTQMQLAQKQTMLAAQVNAMQGQVAADHGALAALQVNAEALSKLTHRMAQLNAIAAARMALQAGQPVGVVPNAPAALAVFADTAPPTLLTLRESFPAIARAALAASLAENSKAGFWAKARLRMEGIITIIDGNHVIFGPPAAGVIDTMRTALDNNDIAKAVAAANQLSPAVQAAMASWLTPARQLLAAQSALADMARQGP